MNENKYTAGPPPDGKTVEQRCDELVRGVDTKVGVYEHWKGGLYFVTGLVHDSTNDAGDRTMVAYTSLATGRNHVRELTEFHQCVWTCEGHRGEVCAQPENAAEALSAPRFKFVGERFR